MDHKKMFIIVKMSTIWQHKITLWILPNWSYMLPLLLPLISSSLSLDSWRAQLIIGLLNYFTLRSITVLVLYHQYIPVIYLVIFRHLFYPHDNSIAITALWFSVLRLSASDSVISIFLGATSSFALVDFVNVKFQHNFLLNRSFLLNILLVQLNALFSILLSSDSYLHWLS